MVPALKECNKDHVLFSDCKSPHNVAQQNVSFNKASIYSDFHSKQRNKIYLI